MDSLATRGAFIRQALFRWVGTPTDRKKMKTYDPTYWRHNKEY